MSEKQQSALLSVGLPAFLFGGVIGWLLSRRYDRSPTHVVTPNSPIKSTGGSIKMSAWKNWDPAIKSNHWTVRIDGDIKRVTLANVRSNPPAACCLTVAPGWTIKIRVSDKAGKPRSGEEICLRDIGSGCVGLELKGAGRFDKSAEPGWYHHKYCHPDGDECEHIGNITVTRSGSDQNPCTFDSLRDPHHPTEICLWTA